MPAPLNRFTVSFRATLALLASLLLGLSAAADAQVSLTLTVHVAPPVLPVVVQPPIPADGYLWTPGYWAWNDQTQQYYWVAGAWIQPPQAGFLWTPGYWGAEGPQFVWHAGYWGPHVGFYGGVNYGYGYVGTGFEGGYWQGGHLYYNTAVNNVSNVHITNVYTKTVVNNVTVNRVSYNGGSGGITARPSAAELAASREPHVEATPAQRQQISLARAHPTIQGGRNGRPTAIPRPGEGRPPGEARPAPGEAHPASVARPSGDNRPAREARPGEHAAQPRTAQPGERQAQPRAEHEAEHDREPHEH